MTAVWQDLRYAVRGLRRAPGFTLVVVVLVLALGIGANVSFFSVLHGVLLRPLPYTAPERLVVLQQGELGGVAYPNLLDWRTGGTSFERIAVYTATRFKLSGDGEAMRVTGAISSADLFALLGTSALLGRTFLPEEDRLGGGPDGARPVVLSHAFWRKHFPGAGAGDPGVLGRMVRLDELPFTIIGVLPEGFTFPLQRESADLWGSVAVDAEPSVYDGTIPTSRGYMRYDAALTRLKRGVSLETRCAHPRARRRAGRSPRVGVSRRRGPGSRGWSLDQLAPEGKGPPRVRPPGASSDVAPLGQAFSRATPPHHLSAGLPWRHGGRGSGELMRVIPRHDVLCCGETAGREAQGRSSLRDGGRLVRSG
ncbi:ABC transporter permease [Myxococcus fulvus]|uniref:ABC transporter permease n=1 Tax=Myxococcus fulvus TaxID=33 RepID=UPI0020C16363|nr:ABC transporter permease [Myxococcus fulvus]MCK8503655.1 ABC transporter permease [Myxococcus fulvus]